MNVRHLSASLLSRPWRVLERSLSPALAGDEQSLHRARVASRRLREALPVAGAGAETRRVRKLRKRLRRVTRALGPIRELDVALQLVDELRLELPTLALALDHAARHIAAERDARRAGLADALGPVDVEDLHGRLSHVQEAVAPRGVRQTAITPEASAALVARTSQRADALRAAVQSSGALYSPEAIHAVRIATKKLRYALEVSRDLHWLRSPRLIASLRSVQNILGKLHDLQVLAEHVSRAQSTLEQPATGIGADLEDLAVRIEERCRTLHAAFLKRREAVLDVCDAVGSELRVPVASLAS
jgi:CHAD domain-containing protein